MTLWDLLPLQPPLPHRPPTHLPDPPGPGLSRTLPESRPGPRRPRRLPCAPAPQPPPDTSRGLGDGRVPMSLFRQYESPRPADSSPRPPSTPRRPPNRGSSAPRGTPTAPVLRVSVGEVCGGRRVRSAARPPLVLPALPLPDSAPGPAEVPSRNSFPGTSRSTPSCPPRPLPPL